MNFAQKGGNVARSARTALEKELGHSVVSPLSVKKYLKSTLSDEQELSENNNE